MGISDYECALATADDITGILDLQEQNLPENGGTLSVRFSGAWFAQIIADMPIVVARCEGSLVGYVVSTSLAAQAHEPIIKAMLAAYPGSPNAYIYGPICVAKDHRGRGVARAMFEDLRARLPGREGFTFIRADNAVSVQVHLKMGMRQVADFTLNNTDYIVVAYQG